MFLIFGGCWFNLHGGCVVRQACLVFTCRHSDSRCDCVTVIGLVYSCRTCLSDNISPALTWIFISTRGIPTGRLNYLFCHDEKGYFLMRFYWILIVTWQFLACTLCVTLSVQFRAFQVISPSPSAARLCLGISPWPRFRRLSGRTTMPCSATGEP